MIVSTLVANLRREGEGELRCWETQKTKRRMLRKKRYSRGVKDGVTKKCVMGSTLVASMRREREGELRCWERQKAERRMLRNRDVEMSKRWREEEVCDE